MKPYPQSNIRVLLWRIKQNLRRCKEKNNEKQIIAFLIHPAFMRVALLVIGGVLVHQLIRRVTKDRSVGPHIATVIGANLSLVVVSIFVFLVARHVIKLFFDRRSRTFGSNLRVRLVTTFGGLILVPTAAVFVLASGLLNQAIEGWVSSQADTVKSASLTVAQAYADSLRATLRREVGELNKLFRRVSIEPNNLSSIEAALERERQAHNLFSVSLYRQDGELVVNAAHPTATLEFFREPPLEKLAIAKAMRGEESLLNEETESSSFFRTYSPVISHGKRYLLVAALRLDPDIADAMKVIQSTVAEYEQIKIFKKPLKSGYLLTLAMVTAMIIFGGIWLALFIARQIVGPLEQLVAATAQVARGNYDITIEPVGDDEVAHLVRSFNNMLADLRTSRVEASERRVFAETILNTVSIGVINFDLSGKILAYNKAAEQLLSIENGTGNLLLSTLCGSLSTPVANIIERLASDPSPVRLGSDGTISTIAQGRTVHLILTGVRVIDEFERWRSSLILIEDITELTLAQQMAAWREVARRIAHEIKNPLTPIQLLAQRLRALLPERREVQESVATILENVDSIKRLANDFSRFARMPTAVMELCDLNELIDETLASYPEVHPEITFRFIAAEKMPEVPLDSEQIRRLLRNLIDNSIAALKERLQRDGSPLRDARVSLRTWYDKKKRTVTLEIADTGVGIPREIQSRVFEPYFTTRPAGSGLGLTIVNSIVSDHQGSIRVYDNEPCGAKFVVEFPLTHRPNKPPLVGTN